MRDAKLSVESCLKTFPDLIAVNVSDGIKIVGAQPQSVDEYLEYAIGLDILPNFADSKLGEWWATSPKYTPQRFLSSWKSRRPRAEISSFIQNFKNILTIENSRSQDVTSSVTASLSLATIPASISATFLMHCIS